MSKDGSNLVVFIMAGGAGTRFWPVSTEAKPKQFLNLFGDRTLLQLSYDRVASMVPVERIFILTNATFVSLVRDQLPQLPLENIIGEPMRRDTAAAVALAALLCRQRFGNPVMGVLTADHLIEPTALFQQTLLSVVMAASQSSDALYTFGIRPTYPATAYGYLQLGDRLHEDDDIVHYQLLRFREKPDLPTACQYLESGECCWNSGMFVWSTDAILEELGKNLPEHIRHLEPVIQHDLKDSWADALDRGFEPLQPISIDFGVMEKATNVRCVAATFHWSDVGGWLALGEFLPQDNSGNSYRGHIYSRDATTNLVFCDEPDETVALVGVQDLVVVRAGKRTLVVNRNKTEEIKKLVQELDKSLR